MVCIPIRGIRGHGVGYASVVMHQRGWGRRVTWMEWMGLSRGKEKLGNLGGRKRGYLLKLNELRVIELNH